MACGRRIELFYMGCMVIHTCDGYKMYRFAVLSTLNSHVMKMIYIIMYFNLLRIASEEVVLSTPRSREGNDKVAPHVIIEDATEINELDKELLTLSDVYGELYEGKIINVTLQELLSLLPRTRKRSDAYRGLISKLERKGVTLNITSKKSKNNINYGS